MPTLRVRIQVKDIALRPNVKRSEVVGVSVSVPQPWFHLQFDLDNVETAGAIVCNVPTDDSNKLGFDQEPGARKVSRRKHYHFGSRVVTTTGTVSCGIWLR